MPKPRYGAISGLEQELEKEQVQAIEENGWSCARLTFLPFKWAIFLASAIAIALAAAFLPLLISPHYMMRHKNHDPNKPLWFRQDVDHFDVVEDTKKHKKTKKWDQRYYIDGRHFDGPGHPIFLVIGGESTLERMLYPFINDHLAKKFKAFVIEPEHRFYGQSQPVGSTLVNLPSNEELAKLLTPQQAMEDMLAITQHYRYNELGCSPNKYSKNYCPLITVGGSYPGFLSAMMRLVHPEIVDIGYAASAPLLLYSQAADQFGYYEVVSRSAERSSPGCAFAVKTALRDVVDEIVESENFMDVASKIGICTDTVPEYITTPEIFAQEAMMIVEDTFADANMDNYPPNNDTDMFQMCQIFQDDALDSAGKVTAFYKRLMESEDYAEDLEEMEVEHQGKKRRHEMVTCFDMRAPLPPGPNSTVSCSDWSGCGPGLDSYMWEFQECTLLIVQIGFSEKSMFPYRPFTMEWLTDHCRSKFGIWGTPQPHGLVEEWGYDDLVARGASNILFTNGLNDMWSAGSYLSNVSETVLALNFPNGAHHSDLSHQGPTDDDTDDLKQGFDQITDILTNWLNEM